MRPSIGWSTSIFLLTFLFLIGCNSAQTEQVKSSSKKNPAKLGTSQFSCDECYGLKELEDLLDIPSELEEISFSEICLSGWVKEINWEEKPITGEKILAVRLAEEDEGWTHLGFCHFDLEEGKVTEPHIKLGDTVCIEGLIFKSYIPSIHHCVLIQ